MLDTAAALSPLDANRRAEVLRLQSISEKSLATKALEVRLAWIQTLVDTGLRKGLTPKTARDAAENISKGLLCPTVELEFDSREIGCVTVGDILANPQRFDHKTLADPIEGVSWGRNKAIFYADNLTIFAFTPNGDTLYKLRHDCTSLRAAITAAGTDAANVLARLIVIAHIGKDEEDQLVNEAKKLSGVRVGTIRDMIEDAREEERKKWRDWYAQRQIPPKPIVLDENGEIPIPDSHVDTRLGSFRMYVPTHQYIYIPTGDLCPGASVNALVPGVGAVKATRWLDECRHVEQMTWAPGKPLIVRGELVKEGGWFFQPGDAAFNLYMPPIIKLGDATDVKRWLDHFHTLYPNDADHMIKWLAFKVQHPETKINHAIVMGGAQGIGKDTLLEPVRHGVGPWNFGEISPSELAGQYNAYRRSIILRVSEARDLGEIDLYALYEATKILNASPPESLPCVDKYIRKHIIVNVLGIIFTTNHRTTSLYLPADDRRHYVAWSNKEKKDFTDEYWTDLWNWYFAGGIENVVAYLHELDLSSFNPKAPPPQTEAWHAIVDASRAPEEAELADALDELENPRALTILLLAEYVRDVSFRKWLTDRKNSRQIPHRLERAGYVRVRNSGSSDGLWQVNYYRRVMVEHSGMSPAKYEDISIGVKRQAIYAKKTLTINEQLAAAEALVARKITLQMVEEGAF